MGLLDSISYYLGSSTPAATPADDGHLTAGKWLATAGKSPAEVLDDPFLVRRLARELLADKGMKSPTDHQLHETRFALAKALKDGSYDTFTSPSEAGVIDVELGSDCCPGNVFYEREAYASRELTADALKLSKQNTFRLNHSYSNGAKGQVVAATFISGRNRSSSDFSHAYGDEPWACYMRAWTMLEGIPQGELLERMSVDLITDTNRFIHAGDPRSVSMLYRAVGAVTRGRMDVAGRIRDGRTLTQMYTFTDDEVANLEKLGIRFHAVPSLTSGSQKGIMEYPDPSTIQSRMEELVSELKEELAKDDADVIGAAASFCRELVALHPYEDSNGRTARVLMNRILAEYGYPPAILSHADSDLTMGESAWKDEVTEGIAHTKRYLEKTSLYSVDSLLGKEKIKLPRFDAPESMVIDGLPFTVGTDGFFYDVTARPYLLEGTELKPLGQMEYYFIARMLTTMPRHTAIDALKEMCASNLDYAKTLAAGNDVIDVTVADDATARAADSAYALRPDVAVMKHLTALADVSKMATGTMFLIHHAKGTAISSLLSKYKQIDLEYWYLEDALSRGGNTESAAKIHQERQALFGMAKEMLAKRTANAAKTESSPHGFTVNYEQVMYDKSALRFDTLDDAIASEGDDTVTIWRGDYAFARVIGMAPNNDPRQPAAREHTKEKFERHVVPHLLQELKALERSGVGSRYLSHTTDLSLLTGRFANKEKSTSVNLGSLPGFVASGLRSAFGSSAVSGPSSTALVPASSSAGVSIRNILGVPGDLLSVRSGRGNTLDVKASRKAFEMKVPKSSLLPGMVSLSPNHAFANEQEVHGLERVSPWGIYATYSADELATRLNVEATPALESAA